MQKAAEQDSLTAVWPYGVIISSAGEPCSLSFLYWTEDSPSTPCTLALKPFWENPGPFHWFSVVVKLVTGAKDQFVFLV